MNTTSLSWVFTHPMLERTGWTLVHSVWQCAAAAMLLAIVLLLIRRSARVRYVAGCIALAIALAAAAVTFVLLTPASQTPATAAVAPAAHVAVPIVAISSGVVESNPGIDWLQRSLPWAAVAWLIGVVMLSARHVGGWMSIRGIRRRAVSLEGSDLRTVFERLIARLGIARPVMLAQSDDVNVPSIIGWLRPIVLLPVSAMTELSPQHLQAMLAHELAHVRRHDFIVNLIQTGVETLLFYHPAIWWISRQIRQERENCCDDLAVSATGDVHAYSEALAAVERLRTGISNPALAATGGSLLKRIRRLLAPEPQRVTIAWPAIVFVAIIACIAASIQVTAPTAEAQNAPATRPGVMNIVPNTPELADLENVRAELLAQNAEIQKEINRAAFEGEDKTPIFNRLKQIDAEILLVEAKIKARNDVPNVYYTSGMIRNGMFSLPDPAAGFVTFQTVLQQSGGLKNTKLEGWYVIVIHQAPVDGQKSHIFLARDVLEGGPGSQEAIRPGDVIMLTTQATLPLGPEERFTVEGQVPRPGNYPWQKNMTLLQALVVSGINPPDDTTLRVQVKIANGPFREYAMGDLISGQAGLQKVGAGDTISVTPMEQARPQSSNALDNVVYSQLVSKYTEAKLATIEAKAKFGPDHQNVALAVQREEALHAAMIEAGAKLEKSMRASTTQPR